MLVWRLGFHSGFTVDLVVRLLVSGRLFLLHCSTGRVKNPGKFS